MDGTGYNSIKQVLNAAARRARNFTLNQKVKKSTVNHILTQSNGSPSRAVSLILEEIGVSMHDDTMKLPRKRSSIIKTTTAATQTSESQAASTSGVVWDKNSDSGSDTCSLRSGFDDRVSDLDDGSESSNGSDVPSRLTAESADIDKDLPSGVPSSRTRQFNVKKVGPASAAGCRTFRTSVVKAKANDFV